MTMLNIYPPQSENGWGNFLANSCYWLKSTRNSGISNVI